MRERYQFQSLCERNISQRSELSPPCVKPLLSLTARGRGLYSCNGYTSQTSRGGRERVLHRAGLYKFLQASCVSHWLLKGG